MAVDTRDKRGSVLGFGLAALLVLPAPGAIDQPDRQQVAYAYRGIQAGNPVPPVANDVTWITVSADERWIRVPVSTDIIRVTPKP